jgi:hypothetical protein
MAPVVREHPAASASTADTNSIRKHSDRSLSPGGDE